MWVRTATKRDLESISVLLGQTWHATYAALYGVEKVSEITAEWHSVAALEKQLKTPQSEFLVADDGSKIAGMAHARQVSDNEVRLQQLYIAPEFQGRGVGKLLLDEIEESFYEVANISLEVEVQNTGAIGFYKVQGFNQTGSTANCGAEGSGIAALVFTKKRRV